MIKKQYIQPSMKAIKIDSLEMICGSGDGIQTMCLGNPGNDDDEPESTSGWGNTGIFGD